MCLAVPGRILDVRKPESTAGIGNAATVDFQGTRVEVSLIFTPEAKAGDWVLVHAGFALNVLDEAEAMETWKYLEAEEAGEFGADTRAEPSSGGGDRRV